MTDLEERALVGCAPDLVDHDDGYGHHRAHRHHPAHDVSPQRKLVVVVRARLVVDPREEHDALRTPQQHHSV